MRLGRTAWLVLGVGFFVIASAVLFMIYSRQSSEGAELGKTLAGAQTQLTTLISGKESLESQLAEQQGKLAEAQALLSSARGSFPALEASIEYDEVLSELALFYDLKVVSMTAEEPRQKKVEDVTFITTSFEVKVQGEVDNILSMVSEIAKDERFASATVEVVDIEVPQPTCPAEEPEEPSATIELVGYSYGGE